MDELMIELKNFTKKYLLCWLKAMESDEMVEAWHGYHDWTVMHMNKVLYPLAKCLGNYCREESCDLCLTNNIEADDKCKSYCKSYSYSIQQEYYNVDFSLYSYYGPSKWRLDYAIEHENAEFVLKDDGKCIKSKGWFDEFVKLFPLKCAKARVVIGYDSFKSIEEINTKLNWCNDILNTNEIMTSLTDSPIILMIFPRTSYIKGKHYNNGLIQVHCFTKEGAVWKDTNNFLSDFINSKDFIDKIMNTYNNIKEKY